MKSIKRLEIRFFHEYKWAMFRMAAIFFPLTLFIIAEMGACSACTEKDNKNTDIAFGTDGSAAVPAEKDTPPGNSPAAISAVPKPEVVGIVAPTVDAAVLAAEEKSQEPLKPPERSIPVIMALIPGGSFQMGDNDGDRDEAPVHPVRLSAFYIGKYQVSQKEYAVMMDSMPGSFRGDALPVENISWFDAVEYCNRLSAKEGLSPAYQGEGAAITCDFAAPGYRLPTEAEWEYAARGRQDQTKYAGTDEVDAVGWYNANSGGMTRKMGTKTPNGFGLYDMSGNVWEWCWDWYGTYSDGGQTNPLGVSAGKVRVVRGGSWGNNEWNLRVSSRSSHAPVMRNSSVGFRIVRSAVPKEN